MRDNNLLINIEDRAPLFIVHLDGYLAQLHVYKLKSQMDKIYQEGGRFILIDLRQLMFLDSAGLGVLVQIRTELMRLAGGLGLVHSEAPQVRQALITSQLVKVIPIYEDLASAKQQFSEKYNLRLDPDTPNPPANPAAAAPPSGPSNEDLLRRIECLELRLGKLERYLSGSSTNGGV